VRTDLLLPEEISDLLGRAARDDAVGTKANWARHAITTLLLERYQNDPAVMGRKNFTPPGLRR